MLLNHDEQQQAEIYDAIARVLRDPTSTAPEIVALPPLHMPGTMQCNWGRFSVRYYVIVTDDGESVVKFIKIIHRW